MLSRLIRLGGNVGQYTSTPPYLGYNVFIKRRKADGQCSAIKSLATVTSRG